MKINCGNPNCLACAAAESLSKSESSINEIEKLLKGANIGFKVISSVDELKELLGGDTNDTTPPDQNLNGLTELMKAMKDRLDPMDIKDKCGCCKDKVSEGVSKKTDDAKENIDIAIVDKAIVRVRTSLAKLSKTLYKAGPVVTDATYNVFNAFISRSISDLNNWREGIQDGYLNLEEAYNRVLKIEDTIKSIHTVSGSFAINPLFGEDDPKRTNMVYPGSKTTNTHAGTAITKEVESSDSPFFNVTYPPKLGFNRNPVFPTSPMKITVHKIDNAETNGKKPRLNWTTVSKDRNTISVDVDDNTVYVYNRVSLEPITNVGDINAESLIASKIISMAEAYCKRYNVDHEKKIKIATNALFEKHSFESIRDDANTIIGMIPSSIVMDKPIYKYELSGILVTHAVPHSVNCNTNGMGLFH